VIAVWRIDPVLCVASKGSQGLVSRAIRNRSVMRHHSRENWGSLVDLEQAFLCVEDSRVEGISMGAGSLESASGQSRFGVFFVRDRTEDADGAVQASACTGAGLGKLARGFQHWERRRCAPADPGYSASAGSEVALGFKHFVRLSDGARSDIEILRELTNQGTAPLGVPTSAQWNLLSRSCSSPSL